MNTALLVLRIIPGLLLMGHGLQKLVPPGYSPPLLHAAGHRGTGAGFCYNAGRVIRAIRFMATFSRTSRLWRAHTGWPGGREHREAAGQRRAHDFSGGSGATASARAI